LLLVAQFRVWNCRTQVDVGVWADPVYLIPGSVGAAGASFLYDFLAHPRLIEQPIEEVVSHEETASAATPK